MSEKLRKVVCRSISRGLPIFQKIFVENMSNSSSKQLQYQQAIIEVKVSTTFFFPKLTPDDEGSEQCSKQNRAKMTYFYHT